MITDSNRSIIGYHVNVNSDNVNVNTTSAEYSPYLIETTRPLTTMTTTSTITACSSSNSTNNDDDDDDNNDDVNDDDIQILSYRSRCSRESTSLSADHHHHHDYNNQDLPNLSSHSINNTLYII